jgi:hypothetical protein
MRGAADFAPGDNENFSVPHSTGQIVARDNRGATFPIARRGVG